VTIRVAELNAVLIFVYLFIRWEDGMKQNYLSHRAYLAAVLVLVALPSSGMTEESGSQIAARQSRIVALLDQKYPDLDALYKDLHANPELGFQEKRTARILAARMRRLGFAVTDGVGGTGVVAILRNGTGRTIMVRTEMDALPMEEKTGLPYASKASQMVDGRRTPVAHSCGHDVHMTSWIGTAEALIAMRDAWKGTLVFVGQPAEEGGGGAKAMIADGLFTRFPKPEFGFAAHSNNLPAGTLFIKDGTTSSASDSLEIVFYGRGGHGSMPSATIDPIVIGAHFVTDVQTVISREKDAAAFGVITVGVFQAGTTANIIPDEAVVRVNLRSHAPEIRSLLREGVERTAKSSAMLAKAPPPTIRYLGGAAAVVNDQALVKHISAALAPVFGSRLTVVPAYLPPFPASEDYSEFIEAGVPSLYMGVGSFDPAMIADFKKRGQALPVNHSPFYAPQPEPTIRSAVMALTLAVIEVAQPR
jgi:hippurate hydrolase